MLTPALTRAPSEAPDPCSQLLLNDTMLQRFANELARGLYDPEDVMKLYGITPEMFAERVKNNPSFMTFYAEGHAIWNASSNAKERIRAKARVISEQWMREANRLLHDPANPMAAKVELAKHFAKIAELEPERETEASQGNGVHVTINLDHARLHPKTIHIDKVLDAQAVEAVSELPAKVTPPEAAPTAGAPEHVSALESFSPSQQSSKIVWPGSAK